jgi:hypothetical protein
LVPYVYKGRLVIFDNILELVAVKRFGRTLPWLAAIYWLHGPLVWITGWQWLPGLPHWIVTLVEWILITLLAIHLVLHMPDFIEVPTDEDQDPTEIQKLMRWFVYLAAILVVANLWYFIYFAIGLLRLARRTKLSDIL